MPIGIQGAQDPHHANDLPSRMLPRFRLEKPNKNSQQRRVIEVRINHVSRMGSELSQRPERRIALRRRRLVVERIEDERHKRIELREDVLSADAGELAECGQDRGGDGRGRVAGFGEEDVEHGCDVGLGEALRSADEEAKKCG